jgi:hypothetical protein
MGSPQRHFPPNKLKKLSKQRMSALQSEIKQQIKKDPMMRALVSAHQEMSKRLREKVGKKFPELR